MVIANQLKGSSLLNDALSNNDLYKTKQASIIAGALLFMRLTFSTSVCIKLNTEPVSSIQIWLKNR